MKYSKVQTGIFKSRPNRFIAYVEVDGEVKTCHVKNTGRCKELLIPGVTVYLEEQDNPKRKTKYDLIGVQKEDRMINMDSQAPNKVVYEWIQLGGLFSDIKLVKAEKTYGNSRFDLYVETENKKIYIEVKGVTLEEKGIVRFPDAPTERGIKHVKELISCVEEGYEAYIIFVVQMKDVNYFEPNDVTHPAFGQALREAEEKGVHILAVDCDVEADRLSIRDNVMVKLQ
jgi:sugar fermentation stimulation protein A